jgi:hypothetical protein
LLASCNKKDNSEVTDQAARDLTSAQSKLGDKQREIATTAEDVERRKRELLAEQQVLADKEKALAANVETLGSAQTTLAEARTAYAAAVTSRLAKLDASLATLGRKTDAASKDAEIGLRARREQLATSIASMSTITDAAWRTYAKDIDVTFDNIERDLKND